MDTDSTVETEFFVFVGKYVLFFQSIESIIDQIILLGKGHENWASSQRYLAKNFITVKTKRAYTMLTNEAPFNGRNDDEWLRFIEDCNLRMLSECKRRAKLLHSHFVWDFVEMGGPVIQSYREKTEQSFDFEQQELNPKLQSEILQEAAQLARDYSLIHTQCIHLVS